MKKLVYLAFLAMTILTSLLLIGCKEDEKTPVDQSSTEANFKFTVYDVKTTSASVHVVAEDATRGFLIMVISKEYFDSVTEDELFEGDMEWFTDYANEIGSTRESLLDLFICRGASKGDVERFTGLKPDTEYVAYSYHLNTRGERLSSIVSTTFKTKSVQKVDCTFNVTVTHRNPYSAHVRIEPSNKDVKWTYTYQNLYYAAVQGFDDDEFVQAKWLETLQSYAKEGVDITYKGDKEFDMDVDDNWRYLWAGMDYKIWMFGVDGELNVVTDLETHTFTTPEVEVTSSATFELEIDQVWDKDARVIITPSDDTQEYYVLATPKQALKSLTLEQIVERGIASENVRIANSGNEYGWNDPDYGYTGKQSVRLGSDIGWVIKPETDYMVVVWGYDDKGHRITEIAQEEFTTEESVFYDDATITFEHLDIQSRSITTKFTPSDPDMWYYAGIQRADFFDQYQTPELFLEAMLHSDGADSFENATVVGEQTMTAGTMSGTKYVVFAFGYSGGQLTTKIFYEYVSSLPLPRSDKADLTATYKIFDGNALADLYPETYEISRETVVFIAWLEPNEYAEHYYTLVTNAREFLNLNDDQVLDYFLEPALSWQDSKVCRYHIWENPIYGFGWYYGCQDKDGAWGPLHYETIYPDMKDVADPSEAPETIGGGAGGTSALKTASATLSTPIRFSEASTMQIERERVDFERELREGPVVLNVEPTREVLDLEYSEEFFHNLVEAQTR